MTADEITPPRPLSRTLSYDIDKKLNAIGVQASQAADEVFLALQADGWHYDYGVEYSEPISETISGRLERMAGQAIQEQLSKAVLAFWVQQRRDCEHECGIEESIGGLFSGLAFIVSSLIGDAVERPGAALVGPAEPSAEEVTA